MADMVGSAVIQETVSQIMSGMIQKYEENEESKVNRSLERLEMAHIRLQAALETSDKWHFTDASLVRWQRKLKRAAEECDDTLQKCKQRILEDEQLEQEVRSLPFPKRIAHATKSFIFSSFSRNNNNNPSITSTVQRFEWFADGASEFLRLLELGGTRRHPLTFDSLIRHLLEGKKLQQKIVRETECPLYLQWVPCSTEYGREANLGFIQKDSDAPGSNFYFGVMLQICESTDIIGITVKCLELFPHHLKSIAEVIRKKVTNLPTLDFSWVAFADTRQREHYDNLHNLSTQWFRPDPLCCKQHDRHQFHRASNLNMEGFPDGSLEPVIQVNLVCHVASCSKYNKTRALLPKPESSLQHSPYLQVGLVYMPHGSSDDLLPAGKSSAIAEISGEEKHWLHTDISLEELNKNMLPKAKGYFDHNIEAAVYQMIWISKHGSAYIQVHKASMEKPSGRRTFQRFRKRVLAQLQDQGMGLRTLMISRFLNSWGQHTPTWLQGSIMSWVLKEMESQLQHPVESIDKGNRQGRNRET